MYTASLYSPRLLIGSALCGELRARAFLCTVQGLDHPSVSFSFFLFSFFRCGARPGRRQSSCSRRVGYVAAVKDCMYCLLCYHQLELIVDTLYCVHFNVYQSSISLTESQCLAWRQFLSDPAIIACRKACWTSAFLSPPVSLYPRITPVSLVPSRRTNLVLVHTCIANIRSRRPPRGATFFRPLFGQPQATISEPIIRQPGVHQGTFLSLVV